MDDSEFRDWSIKAAELGATYRGTLRERPVRARTQPGEIAAGIAASPPETPEPMQLTISLAHRLCRQMP